jgi:hypothetical protein
MVLVLVLDDPADRVRVRVLPFGRSTSAISQGDWMLMVKDVVNDRAKALWLVLHTLSYL